MKPGIMCVSGDVRGLRRRSGDLGLVAAGVPVGSGFDGSGRFRFGTTRLVG